MVDKNENKSYTTSHIVDQTNVYENEPYPVLESWNGAIDLTPYKLAHVWPGESYCLMGNSFNVEIREINSSAHAKRISTIKLLLKTNHSSITIKDAFANTDFLAVLSRFEQDWLKRLRPDTLIGPAYDELGDLLPEAFSVWRRDFLAPPGYFTRH